jgi:hypothetical protein
MATGSREKSLAEHWKEFSAVIASSLTIVVTIVVIGEKLHPIIPILISMASCIAVCVYVIRRRTRSSLKPESLLPLFGSRTRNAAKALLIMLCFVMVLCPFLYTSQPVIERINPIDPVAGGKLQIFGRHLPDSSSIQIEFAETKVTQYYTVSGNFIEVRVPEEIVSGPLRLRGKRRILPDRELVYPIVSVQTTNDDVVLITEDIRTDEDHYQVLFSALNTTKHRIITVYDIELEVVALEALESPNFLQERIDLGIVSIFTDDVMSTRIDLLTQSKVHLLDEAYTIRLAPMRTESFHFRLMRPDAQHKLRFIFVISVHFFDNAGSRGVVYGNRFFAVNSSDISGISVPYNLPLNEESYRELEQQYQNAFRSFTFKRNY